MSKMRVDFFATPEEQRRWLKSLLAEAGIWSVVWWPGTSQPFHPATAEWLDTFDFTGDDQDEVILFVGRSDLAEAPVYSMTSTGKTEVDFRRSRAFQYVPSIVARDAVLLEGRLAIMAPKYYRELTIDPVPLRRWFIESARSLNALRARHWVLIQRTTSGSVKHWPDTIVTEGAVEWRRVGRYLKQFANSTVEFDVQLEHLGSATFPP